MNDDADIFVISALIALSLALLVVYLVGFTNAWVAGLTVLALPLFAVGLTIVIAKAITRRRRVVQGTTARSAVGEPVAFIQEWLGKGRRLRDSLSPSRSMCSIDSDCPPGHTCIDGRCEPQY